MPRLAELGLALRAGLLTLLALALMLPAWGDPYVVKLATRILVFALAAAALDLALGVGGMVSFGHAAFLGLGAYVVGINFLHGFEGSLLLGFAPTQSLVLQLVLAALLAGGFALLTGAISLRTRGVAFIMITLAFAQMLYYLFVSLRRYNGADGIALWNRSDGGLLDLEDPVAFYFLCLAALLLFLFVGGRLYHSRFGRALRAARDNERRAQALGIDTYRVRLVAYGISGAVTGIAGVLLANATYFVGPAYLSWPVSGQLLVMVVLGGMGTLVGPVFGALVLLLLEEFLPGLLDSVRPGLGESWKIVLGPLLVAIALYARGGLWGVLARRRVARVRWTGPRAAKAPRHV